MVEKELPDKVIPVPYSIRKCNEKNLIDISNEIRKVKSEKSEEKDQLLEKGWILSLYNILPKILRQIIVKRMIKNPLYIKRNGGLIVLTSISVFASSPGWVLSFGGMLTMSVSLGGTSTKNIMIKEKLVAQEFLDITFDIDHDIVDGGPATRFVSYLVSLLESGYLLDRL